MGRRRPEATVIRTHAILGAKNEELSEEHHKWKARSVAHGGDVRDVWGQQVKDEQWYTMPMSLSSFRTLAALSILSPDDEIFSFDVTGAYLQSPRPTDTVYARLPPSLMTARMQKMKDPVVQLKRMLYGEVPAGDY